MFYSDNVTRFARNNMARSTDNWYFKNPEKTGQYLCLLDMGDICGQHNYSWELLDFFKEGEDAGAEYADKHNFWARLYEETWEWIEVKNVVCWQYLTFPAELERYR